MNSHKSLLFIAGLGLGALGMAYAILQLLDFRKPVVPDVELTSLRGQTVSVTEFQGRPSVINLWASWCPPCQREMPALQEGQRSNPDIHFVFANQGEVATVVETYLAKEGLALDNVLLDKQGELARAVQSAGLPTTLFLDEQGRLVDMRLGELSSDALQDHVNALRSASTLTRSLKD